VIELNKKENSPSPTRRKITIPGEIEKIIIDNDKNIQFKNSVLLQKN
jgi:hypothetical protein